MSAADVVFAPPPDHRREEKAIVLDMRQAQPPEPFLLTLDALAQCQEEQWVRLLLWRRHPVPLLQYLDETGWQHRVVTHPDGMVEVQIWR